LSFEELRRLRDASSSQRIATPSGKNGRSIMTKTPSPTDKRPDLSFQVADQRLAPKTVDWIRELKA
jgi:hypothetical protein